MHTLTSELVEHINKPYSIDALGAERKALLEADVVPFAELPHKSTGFFPHVVKATGESPRLTDQSGYYEAVHALFCGALLEVLGDDMFEQARVYFDHLYSEFNAGQRRTFGLPHLDGTAPGGFNDPAMSTTGESGAALKLVGTACNTLPTIGLQGPTKPEDYGGEPRTHLMPTIAEDLVSEEFPTGKLVIVPSSLPHYSQIANSYTQRHFLRWQVMIDL